MKKETSSPQIAGVMVSHHNMMSPQNDDTRGEPPPLATPLNPARSLTWLQFYIFTWLQFERNHLLYHFSITIHLHLASFNAKTYFEKKSFKGNGH